MRSSVRNAAGAYRSRPLHDLHRPHFLQHLNFSTRRLVFQPKCVVHDMGQPIHLLNPGPREDRIRLHITPFNLDLVDRIIPPSLKSEASDISFHSIQTFPERGFGFVELPAMAAEKLKNKLNGTTLKGAKVKIEDAKPDKVKKRKVHSDTEEAAELDKAARKKAKREQKKQREDGVLPGHELEAGRHVKRGWVDDVAKKTKSKRDGSDGIEGKKMNFKTAVPPNKSAGTKPDGKTKNEKKEKKETERKDGKKIAVVKEFDKTQKALTSAIITKPAEDEAVYEDGQGWVKSNGEVVEAETKSAKRRREKKAAEEAATIARSVSREALHSRTELSVQEQTTNSSSEDDDDDSSVVSSDSSASEQESASPSSANSDSEPMAVDPSSPEPAKDVHPLEALFKRAPADASRPKPAPIDTSFNFFSSDAATVASQEDDGAAVHPPQTPHTRQDMEWRGLRSAAPTPDTAAVSRHSSFPFPEDFDEAGDEGQDENEYSGGAATGEPVQNVVKEESEFRKWFYENRGDLNRGWKKRRREERKTKRQRENRKMNRRVV
nr:hypothetical protein CFP56_21806 [Quercus suber]